MYKTIREYVETLNDEVLIEILRDYEQFESEGAIGDWFARIDLYMGSKSTSFFRWVNK